MQRVTVKLEVPIEINLDELEITKESFSKHLGFAIDDEQSNRPTFDVELITHGLLRVIREAARNAIEEVHQKKYDREYVEHKDKDGRETGCTAKWCITSLEYVKKIKLQFIRSLKGMIV